MPEGWLMRWIAAPYTMVGQPLGFRQAWARPLAGLLTAIADAGLETAALPRTVISDQIGAMVALLADAGPITGSSAGESLEKRIRDTIQARYEDPALNPSAVARELAISPRHLHRILARTGSSFGAMLNAARLSAAESLLTNRRTEEMPIGEIAWAVGYADQSHFARVFKVCYGQSPSQFRAALRRIL